MQDNTLHKDHLTRAHHGATSSFSYDLRTQIPIHSLSEEEKEERWADGLHLTETGYNWMGDRIADGFLPLLQNQQGRPAKAKTQRAARHRASPSDQQTFEEESEGNARDISQGYVVVRRKDLE